MRVLVGCEHSGKVRDAFLALGHDAISCDLLPTESPGPHYQGDVFDIINDGWDLGIFFPDCTYLCASGLHWNHRVDDRGKQTRRALRFVRRLLGTNIPRIALENPKGCISTKIRPATQYIQPYQFGHDASKETGLWLKNLPRLRPTKYVKPRLVYIEKLSPNDSELFTAEQVGHKFKVPRWANQTDSGQNKLPPSADRWKLRAETYSGIADAMADQWGQTKLRKSVGFFQ